MPEAEIFRWLLICTFALAVVIWLVLEFITAPYGRFGRAGWGPKLPVRAAWVLMEAPSVFLFGACYAVGSRAGDVVALVLAALWLGHYVHRTFVYPMRLRAGSMPVVVVGMGFAFNVLNSYLNGRSLTEFGPVHATSWLWSAPFLIGLVLFGLGFAINRWADRVLRNLRAPGETGYKIPRGGLYEFISCPNYFGEILQWSGFALAAWSPAALAFAVFTTANLLPRARSSHAWYRKTFPNYPTSRRALIPYVL